VDKELPSALLQRSTTNDVPWAQLLMKEIGKRSGSVENEDARRLDLNKFARMKDVPRVHIITISSGFRPTQISEGRGDFPA
jgi:hypothetical protein